MLKCRIYFITVHSSSNDDDEPVSVLQSVLKNTLPAMKGNKKEKNDKVSSFFPLLKLTLQTTNYSIFE
jgi:hypothetical protein